MKKKNKKKKIKIILIILIILILIILVSLLFLKITNTNKKIIYSTKNHVNDVKKSIKNNDTSNYKTIGWIDVDDTNISFPIFRIVDNYSGTSLNIEGFSWTYSTDGKYHNYMTIFGHNLMNLGIPEITDESFNRFEELMGFAYYDFAEKHKYFQVTLNNKEYVYKIFSVSILSLGDVDEFPINGATKSEMKHLLYLFDEYSIYKYNIKVNENDSIIALSTCTKMFNYTGSQYDLVVAGRLVRDNEKASDYSIKKKEKYNMVEEALNQE